MMNISLKTRLVARVAVVLAAVLAFGLAACDNPAGDDDTYYTVTFDSRGGSTAPVQSVLEGGKAAVPSPVPSRDDYTFDGWYTSPTGGDAWDFAVDTVTAAITLYAQWTAIPPNTWVVSFDADGGSPVPANQNVVNGAKLSSPSNPVKTGYIFGGWYLSLDDDEAWNFNTGTVTGAITLHAKWTIRTYTVTFNARGGSPVDSQPVSYDGKITKPEDPVNGVLILEGWYREYGYINKWNFEVDTVTEAVTLYAKWVDVPPGYFLVSFNSMGGSNVDTQTIAENGKVVEPGAPTRNNYVFDAWYKEQNLQTAWNFGADTITGTTTLYAKWIPTYTVTFNAQSGSAVDPLAGVAQGATIAKPAPDPERAGFRFAGWYKESAGTNEWNFAADTVTGNTTLYAKWLAVYTVTFDSGGGSVVPPVENILGGGLVAQPTAPSLNGCVFAGWYKEAAYTNLWNFAADTVTRDTTIYARWTVTVAFNTNGGSTAPDSQTFNRGGLVTKPAADPVRDGQTFTGWYKEAAGTAEWDFATERVNAGTTIYAHWTFVAVTGIANVPADGIIGEALALSAAVVEPADASRTTITWSVANAGNTGISSPSFTPTAIGTGEVILTATVAGGLGSGNFTKNFPIPITRIREVTGISGIATLTGLAKDYVVDLNAARVTPSNATNKDIVWSIEAGNDGAGVSTIPPNKQLRLTEAGTLTLTATIVESDKNDVVVNTYTEDFSFTVDKANVPGGVDLGDDTSIELYANGGAEPLSASGAITVVKGAEYYINIDTSYTNIVWRLNGRVSSVTGSKLYLDTTNPGTVTVTVEAELGGDVNDGAYTFIIK
jgi:uncharacterized repeat protein (TIGR02543 family)